IIDLGDMLVLEPGRSPGLADKAFDIVGVLEALRVHEFQGPRLEEVQVGGGDDHAHPAGAEHAIDAVFTGEDLPLVDRRWVGGGVGAHRLLGARASVEERGDKENTEIYRLLKL